MLELFAGVGGATIAAHRLGITTTQFVEIDADAQLLLRSHYPSTPIHEDIRSYSPIPGEQELYWISFPCTGTSNAGTRTGLNHPDSALWREAWRCICIGQPQFVIVEQPEGFITRGLRECLGALRLAGYHAEDPLLLSAKEVGAMHERNRLFVLSYSNQLQFRKQPTSWDNQVRTVVQETRDCSTWLSVKRSSDGSITGIPRGLLRSTIATPAKYPGRIRARYLAGRCVTPAQATVPLARVLYLSSLVVPADCKSASL